MRTKVTTQIITRVDELAFGYWDESGDEWIEPKSTDEAIKAAEKLKCSPALIEALALFAELLTDAISQDLRDIWKRLK